MECLNKFIEQEKQNGKSGWITYTATELYNKVKPFYNDPFELTISMFGRKIKDVSNGIIKKKKSNCIYYAIMI